MYTVDQTTFDSLCHKATTISRLMSAADERGDQVQGDLLFRELRTYEICLKHIVGRPVLVYTDRVESVAKVDGDYLVYWRR